MVSTRGAEKKKIVDEDLFAEAAAMAEKNDSVETVDSVSSDSEGGFEGGNFSVKLKMRKSRKRRIVHFADDCNYEAEQSRDLLKDSTITEKPLISSCLFGANSYWSDANLYVEIKSSDS